MEMTFGKMKHQYVQFWLYKLNLFHTNIPHFSSIFRRSVGAYMLCAIWYSLWNLKNVKNALLI